MILLVNNSINIYIDTILIYNIGIQNPNILNRTSNYIGTTNNNDLTNNILIDEFRIYNKILSINEIQVIYNTNIINNYEQLPINIVNVGQYNIIASGLYSYNYDVVYVPGIINITQSPLIIKSNNGIKIYDSLPFTPSYTIYGLKQNSDLSGFVVYTGSYYNQINVGTYTIIPSGLSSLNYNIKYISSTLQIVQTPLMIIAYDDIKIYTNDISNYLLIYNYNHYNISPYTIHPYSLFNIYSYLDTFGNSMVWSLNGYEGPCYLYFDVPDINCSIGLSEINYSYNINNVPNNELIYLINNDGTNINIIDNTGITIVGPSDNISKFNITFNGSIVSYYMNNILINVTNRNKRQNLYINLYTWTANQQINNIQFGSLPEYYSGGNGYYCDGLQINDTINSLNGTITYSGSSQNANAEGIYEIIPGGLSSPNYNIKFVSGHLTIKKSILS
jgi:hypothetical protein